MPTVVGKNRSIFANFLVDTNYRDHCCEEDSTIITTNCEKRFVSTAALFTLSRRVYRMIVMFADRGSAQPLQTTRQQQGQHNSWELFTE